MKKIDPALSFANPRLLAAMYFGFLSIVGTVIMNTFLNALGMEYVIPMFEAVLLGMVVAAIMGAIFGERIIHCERPYKLKTFLEGFSMVIASIPLFALGLVLLMKGENKDLFSVVKLNDMVLFYLVVMAYCYILFGIPLAAASGLAAMYLRGQLIYDIMHLLNRGRRADNTLEKTKPEKAQSHH